MREQKNIFWEAYDQKGKLERREIVEKLADGEVFYDTFYRLCHVDLEEIKIKRFKFICECLGLDAEEELTQLMKKAA